MLLANGDQLILIPCSSDAKQSLGSRRRTRDAPHLHRSRTALSNPDDTVYFDATLTNTRAANVRCHRPGNTVLGKPLAISTDEAMDLALAERAGVKHGVVQDKLFLPGVSSRLVDAVNNTSERGEFGYWVPRRLADGAASSWNYRREDGAASSPICSAIGATCSIILARDCRAVHRSDARSNAWTNRQRYKATADDAPTASFGSRDGRERSSRSSTLVDSSRYRDELLKSGGRTLGSAVAGLRACKTQHRVNTPKPVWNPDVPNPIDFYANWHDVPDNTEFDNAFKVQWEGFLRHVADDAPFIHDFFEGAKGVQLAELGLESWARKCWLDVPPLNR